MKKVLAVVLAAVLVCSFAAHKADAQVPLLKGVFDGDFGKDSKDCPGPVLDTVSWVLSNWNTYLGSIEFAVQYPPSITWVGEAPIPNSNLVLGDTRITAGPWFGITVGYGNNPVNAFSTALVHETTILWNCLGCNPPTDEVLAVVPNGLSGLLQGAVWPTNVLMPIYGGISVVCPTPVPTQEQTWGQIKSLYGE